MPASINERSVCSPRCGDGLVTGDEQCDCGDGAVAASAACNGTAMNMDGVYGGCNTQCKLGPACGDGVVTTPQEQCDLGTQSNTAHYGDTAGCTPSCRLPHRCGDGIVDAGEECDLGNKNGIPGEPCGVTCRDDVP